MIQMVRKSGTPSAPTRFGIGSQHGFVGMEWSASSSKSFAGTSAAGPSTFMIIPIQRSFGRLISRRFHNCRCCSPWQARNGYHKLRYEQYEELDHLLFYGLLAFFLELIISTIATIASRIPTRPVTSPTVRAALASSSAPSISSWAFLISSCASLNVSRAN